MKYLLLTCIFIPFQFIFCQNIFDYESSFKYANYLNEHKDYGNLLQVLNTLETSYPDSITVKLWKAKCLINSKKPAKALVYLATFNADAKEQNEYFFLQLKSILLSDSFTILPIGNRSKSNASTNELLCYYNYYLHGFDSAILFTQNTILDTRNQAYIISVLTENKTNYKHKSPALACLLSIVPGLGQVYTKQYGDAFLGLIPVYINGTIAAFSFAQYGSQSVFGWVNLSLASGFYFGSIYGAYQSAKRLNNLNFIKTNYEIKNRIISLDF